VAPLAAIDALFVACAHIQPQRSLALLQQKDEDSRSRWYSPIPEQSGKANKRRNSNQKEKLNYAEPANGASG
jgi:hypothetical protein